MTGSRPCPSCGEPLKARAKLCECGWEATSPTAGAPPGTAASRQGFDRDRFRCAWIADGKQCRYPGSCTRGTLGSGTLYCFGHLACSETGDAELGKTIVDKSEAEVPVIDGDYSAEGMVAHARVAHRERVEDPRAMRPPDGATRYTKPVPRLMQRVGAIGAAAFPGADKPVDPELIAERNAMQFEGDAP